MGWIKRSANEGRAAKPHMRPSVYAMVDREEFLIDRDGEEGPIKSLCLVFAKCDWISEELRRLYPEAIIQSSEDDLVVTLVGDEARRFFAAYSEHRLDHYRASHEPYERH